MRSAIDHSAGLRLLADLRDRGAQVRLVPSQDDAAVAAAVPQSRVLPLPAPPPPQPLPQLAPPNHTNRLLMLMALFGAATALYVAVAPIPRPLPPPPTAESYTAPTSLFPSQLEAVSHQLNNDAVSLNAAGQFADAADKLRDAMKQAPDEPALRRNLQTVLHNWAVAELNANHPDMAIDLLEQGLAIQEDRNLLSALGIARAREGTWGEARPALERAVELGANDPYTLITLGKIYRQQGEREAAVEMFHRARESGAAGPDFQETLSRLERELDAEWDFAEMRSPHFQIAFAGGQRETTPRRGGGAGAGGCVLPRRRQARPLPGERVPVVLYSSQDFHDIADAELDRRRVRRAHQLPSRGFEEGDQAVVERTLRHEYGHVLVNQLSRGRAPVWLNEGVAIWCEEERDGDREDWAYRTLSGQVLFSLQELEGSFTRLNPERVHVAYAQSYLAIRRLVDRSGGRSMRELLTSLGKGDSLDEAFRDVYSRNLASFESEFIGELTHG